MSEKRFEFYSDENLVGVLDTVTGRTFNSFEIVDCLNEQQATIDKLDQENADLLGARIKAQEEWEKCTDKLKAKILEQQDTIDKLEEENKELRKQCFELEKDYLIETSDISDKIYLEDEIKGLKQRYGVDDE